MVISKQDVSGKEIAGAELKLTQNGKEVEHWTSEAGKSHNFSAEADKEYVLTETTAPKGYAKAESITFKVDAKGKVQVKQGDKWVDAKDNKVVMVDKKTTPWTPLVPAQHKVVISKQDVSGKEIAGAELKLTQNGKEVEHWTSEAGKSHNFSAEADKEYVLTETTAPKGYEVAESITFKVDDKGKVQVKQGDKWVDVKDNKVVMVDKKTTPWTPLVPAQHKVVISKQDVSGKEIAGAELKLTQNGKEVEHWTSEAGKSHNFSAEADKEYVLTETTAPKGYAKAESITFKVDAKGKVQVKQGDKWVDAKDNKVVMVDKTKEDNGGTNNGGSGQDDNQGGKGNHNNVNNSSYHTSMDQTKKNIMNYLPQTGAQWGQFLSVIGLILILIALVLYFIIRRKQHK